MTRRSKKKNKRKHAQQKAPRPAAPVIEEPVASTAQAARATNAPFALGTICILVAIAMSAMLAVEHLGLLALPGCGPRSACAEAASSYWAELPGTHWPIAFVGLAYFVGASVVWLGGRGKLPALFAWIARLGALISVWLLIVLAREGHACGYCIGTHAANLIFWGLIERTRIPRSAPRRLLFAAFAAFVLVSVLLGVIERGRRAEIRERGEQDLAASTERIIDATGRDSGESTGEGFRGRWLFGPERAAARIVMFTDYQCEDCQGIEEQARTLLERHEDVSLSVKHFPYCEDCNPTVDRTLHANACWAARAAEAAGILWGEQGFRDMHNWLFDQGGTFTSEQAIEAGVRAIGRDPRRFVETMTGEKTLEGIEADIQEARLIGLFQTPMIFINGVELRGWQVPDALTRAVEALLATNPEPRTHAQDRAPLAVEKCVGDWLDPRNRARSFPPDRQRTILGAEPAAVRVVLFGDYQEPTCAEADQVIRAWMEGRDDAQYVWRHFPVDRSCNPHVSKTQMPQGCWAARTAEAAAALGDPELYWRVHAWLIRHPGSLDDASLRAAARELDVDVDLLLAAREGSEIGAALSEDVAAGKRIGLRGVPLIFVNERQVVRWRWLGKESGERILQAILEEASKG